MRSRTRRSSETPDFLGTSGGKVAGDHLEGLELRHGERVVSAHRLEAQVAPARVQVLRRAHLQPAPALFARYPGGLEALPVARQGDLVAVVVVTLKEERSELALLTEIEDDEGVEIREARAERRLPGVTVRRRDAVRQALLRSEPAALDRARAVQQIAGHLGRRGARQEQEPERCQGAEDPEECADSNGVASSHAPTLLPPART